MKTRKIVIILIFPLIAEVIVSCCNHCIEPTLQKYTNKSISLRNLDNTGKEPVESASSSILQTAYGIRVELIREKTACLERRNSLFIQSANAYTCVCPPPLQFLPKDTISSIRIFTLHDFDSNHLTNSEITDYFKVYSPYFFSTVVDFLKKPGAILYAESELITQIDLLLMTAPAMNQQHRFRVQITLSDGRVLEGETATIALI